MEKVKMITLLFAALVLTFSACKKDDDEPGVPIEITGIEITGDNAEVKVTFNQSVYREADQTGNLTANSFALTFMASSAVSASYLVEHTPGSRDVIFKITYETRLKGDEVLEVTAKADLIFGAEGNKLGGDLKTSIEVKELGVIGKWSAYDVSNILRASGFDDSLFATFRADQSYLVQAFMGGTALVLEGVYETNKTQHDDIYEITLNQTSFGGQPTDLTSMGIFKVFMAATDSMWYEVAQVSPEIPGVTPPTADQGFGSTSSGFLGTDNVQKYNWIGQ